MKPILDATMGNRLIWNHKNPPNVVFLDKEHDLTFKPTVIADHRFCPFRDGIFSLVIFDPPYSTNLPPWMLNKTPNPSDGSKTFYGVYKSKRDLLSSIHKAQREFQRLNDRLVFKCSEIQLSLWKILPLFVKDGWMETNRLDYRHHNQRGKNKTWWITFIQKRRVN